VSWRLSRGAVGTVIGINPTRHTVDVEWNIQGRGTGLGLPVDFVLPFNG